MAGRINTNTIMEEEDEDQYSTQNNIQGSNESECRMNNKNMFRALINNQNFSKNEQLPQNYPYNQQAISMQNDFESDKQSINNQEQDQEASLEQEKQLEVPQLVKDLLQYDESLYDLMRHKIRFKFQFGKEFFLASQKFYNESQNTQENRILTEYELLEKNYECFNVFFFQNQQLEEKNVLEIHHSQSTEKNQLLNFIISEVLRDQACKDVQEQSQIAPEILIYDNTQQFNYLQIKQMIKTKLFQFYQFKQTLTQSQDFQSQSQANHQVLETLFESISENCLQKLHIVESHSNLEFCVNLRAIKHILQKNKSIRLVIIDEMNAFYAENEYNANHHKTPSKDEDESNNIKKKKKVAVQHNAHHKMNISKQFDTVIREYLEEVQNKFTRVSFIQTKRDYLKVRSLMDFKGDRFQPDEKLVKILSKEQSHLNFDQQSIYCLSLDNFSVQAVEKVLELIKQSQITNQVYINPQKVSVVVKKNLYREDQEDGEQGIQIEQFKYNMGFYTFEKGDFKVLSENQFYFNGKDQ